MKLSERKISHPAASPRESSRAPILTSLTGLLFLLPLVIFLYARLTLPGDGTQVVFDLARFSADGLVIRPLVPSLDGLREGDIVVSIDDHSTSSLLGDAFAGRLAPISLTPGTLNYTITRDGQRVDLATRFAPFPWVQALVSDWTIYLVLLYIALIGFYVFFQRPGLASARVFFLFGVSALTAEVIYVLGFQMSDLLHGWLVPMMVVANTALWFFTLSGILHFSLIFPRPQPWLQRQPARLIWVYASVWFVYAVLVASRWNAATTAAALLQIHWQATYLVGGVYILVFLISFVGNFRRNVSASERRQLRWVVWGTSIAFVPWLALLVLSSLFGVPVRSNLPVLGISFLAIPTTFAIAILRERLFDIDLIINRTLVYGPLTAILAGLFAASITFSQKVFVVVTGEHSDAAIVLTTLLVVAAFTPIKDALQKAVDKRFKEVPTSTKRLQAFGEQVQSRVTAVEPHQIARRLLEESALAFGAENGAAFLHSGGELKLIDTVGTWDGRAKLSVPLETAEHEQPMGVLMLGERARGLEYTPHDLEVLKVTASLVAMAIEQDTGARS